MSIVTEYAALSGHLKIYKIMVLMENGSLMKVESIAAFCNTFDMH